MGRDMTRVSLLKFADDTIFSFKLSPKLLQTLKLILLVFGQVSRLKINLQKNTLFDINTSWELLSSLASILDYRMLEWSLSYLDLPLGRNPKTICFWDSVVKRISKRLDRWKKAFLSPKRKVYLNLVKYVSHS